MLNGFSLQVFRQDITEENSFIYMDPPLETEGILMLKQKHAQKIVHNAHFFVHKTKNTNAYAILRTRISGKTRVKE
jgi:16S rRNA G966 N2-methylase RsmD